MRQCVYQTGPSIFIKRTLLFGHDLRRYVQVASECLSIFKQFVTTSYLLINIVKLYFIVESVNSSMFIRLLEGNMCRTPLHFIASMHVKKSKTRVFLLIFPQDMVWKIGRWILVLAWLDTGFIYIYIYHSTFFVVVIKYTFI